MFTRHGNQGILNTASKGTLENEFGTSNEDEVLKQILQKGDVQTTQVRHDITRADITHQPHPSCVSSMY